MPKFDDRETALNLAYTGAIKDEILDIVELAARLVIKLSELYPKSLEKDIKLSWTSLALQGRNTGAMCQK